MHELQFFNPYGETKHTENRLPHWQQNGALYFITFRLHDAIPAHLRSQWESEREIWIRLHPEPGALRSKLNIISASPVRSSDGSMLAMGRVFSVDPIAQR
jgi:hypothetical protein